MNQSSVFDLYVNNTEYNNTEMLLKYPDDDNFMTNFMTVKRCH